MTDRIVRVRLEALVQGFKSGMAQARQSTDQLTSATGQQLAGMTKLGATATATGGLIVKGLRDAGRESANYSASITKLTTQVGIARNEAQALGRDALALASTGRGPQELGDALFFVTSSGMRGAQALDVLRASAKAAAIGLGETKTVADLVTSAVNAYGPEVLSAAQATDVLIGAVREGKAEAPELAASLGRVLPIASQLGIAFEDVTAAVAAQTRTGTNAATANTQLRAIMVGLIKPSNDAAEALGEVGLSAGQLRAVAAGPGGLWEALQMIKTAVGDNDEQIARIFPNIRALAGFLDLVGANAEQNSEIFDRQRDTLGLLEQGYEEWGTTTEAAQNRFSAAMERMRVVLGGDIEPAMRSTLDTGTAVANMIAELDPTARKAVTGVAALSGGLLTVGGSATLALVGFNHIRNAARETNVSLAGTAKFLTGPWGIAMVGATAAITLFVNHKIEQQKRIDAVRHTLDEETGAITENSRQWITNELIQKGAAEQARDLGLSMETVVDATMGNIEARRLLAAVSREAADAERAEMSGISKLDPARRSLMATVDQYARTVQASVEQEVRGRRSQAEQKGQVADLAHAYDVLGRGVEAIDPTIARLAVTHSRAADAAEEQAGQIDGLGDEMDTAASLADELNEALAALSDPFLNVHRQTQNLEKAQADYNEAVKEYGRESSQAQEASILAAQAGLTLLGAVNELNAATEDGTTSAAGMHAAIDQLAAAFGWSEEQADAAKAAIDGVADSAGELDGKAVELRVLADTASAEAGIGRVAQSLNRILGDHYVNVRMQLSGAAMPSRVGAGVPVRHSGGPADWSGAQRSLLDLAPDEVPIIAQKGEWVTASPVAPGRVLDLLTGATP